MDLFIPLTLREIYQNTYLLTTYWYVFKMSGFRGVDKASFQIWLQHIAWFEEGLSICVPCQAFLH